MLADRGPPDRRQGARRAMPRIDARRACLVPPTVLGPVPKMSARARIGYDRTDARTPQTSWPFAPRLGTSRSRRSARLGSLKAPPCKKRAVLRVNDASCAARMTSAISSKSDTGCLRPRLCRKPAQSVLAGRTRRRRASRLDRLFPVDDQQSRPGLRRTAPLIFRSRHRFYAIGDSFAAEPLSDALEDQIVSLKPQLVGTAWIAWLSVTLRKQRRISTHS